MFISQIIILVLQFDSQISKTISNTLHTVKVQMVRCDTCANVCEQSGLHVNNNKYQPKVGRFFYNYQVVPVAMYSMYVCTLCLNCSREADSMPE